MNSDHPLLTIHPHIWPLMVLPPENTRERHLNFQSLLSTCQALRKHLLPLFIILNPLEYLEALQGYYIKTTQQNDYYLHIHGNLLTFSVKYGVDAKKRRKEHSPINVWKEKTDVWEFERVVDTPSKQMVIINSPAFLIEENSSSIFSSFSMERYKPILTGNSIHCQFTQQEFEIHKKRYKNFFTTMRVCGAAVVTPESPCCHEAISGIARKVLEEVPKDFEGYNELVMKMSGVVEDLSQECMKNAMEDCEIYKQIVSNIVRIAPQLKSALSF